MPISFYDLAPVQESFGDAMQRALASPVRALSPKFLYDQAGADLFERITELPEYYPTRTEVGILRSHAREMASAMGPQASLIEFGASSSSKVRILLEALDQPRAYVPVDVAAEHLRQAAEDIAGDFPGLQVVAVCADYTDEFELPPEVVEGAGSHVGFFPGSTIGNLDPEAAVRFLRMWSGQLGPGGGMLVGVDLVKDGGVLEQAYDDSQGVTAAFSLNLLVRANRELGCDFDLSRFRHVARWEPQASHVSIHLLSLADQEVHLGHETFHIAAGELIHVENSHKYTLASFAELARRGGFDASAVWTDPERLFSVHFLTAAR